MLILKEFCNILAVTYQTDLSFPLKRLGGSNLDMATELLAILEICQNEN